MTIGSKVVCVDDKVARCGCFPAVQNGQTYSVRGVRVKDNGTTQLSLAGVHCAHVCGKAQDNWLDARRFRLLDELKKEARESKGIELEVGR